MPTFAECSQTGSMVGGWWWLGLEDGVGEAILILLISSKVMTASRLDRAATNWDLVRVGLLGYVEDGLWWLKGQKCLRVLIGLPIGMDDEVDGGDFVFGVWWVAFHCVANSLTAACEEPSPAR